MDKKNKKIIIISTAVILALAFLTAIGIFVYHKKYEEKFRFKGLGDIYQNRNQQYRMFTERKITLDNKGNPPKTEVSNLPAFIANFATNLPDNTYISIRIDFRFEKAEGIKEIRRKWERIAFATSIALSAYSADDLKDLQGKDEVLVILENQVRKRIFSKIKYIYIDIFDLKS